MTEHFVRLGARHFSALASGDPVLWSEVIGAKVTHADYGAGEIVAVEQRLNYTPLITLRFANALKTWTVQSFDNDKTWISLDPSLIARAESMATARATARAELERQPKLRAEAALAALSNLKERIGVKDANLIIVHTPYEQPLDGHASFQEAASLAFEVSKNCAVELIVKRDDDHWFVLANHEYQDLIDQYIHEHYWYKKTPEEEAREIAKCEEMEQEDIYRASDERALSSREIEQEMWGYVDELQTDDE
ncbi:hypothetical protein [Thermomonas aquatica]|uniref:Uncharacterized protein n=1 Tax=Thermomonas aquatica TaxID=2202149 RepID=A0A5B7ZQ35_9GAMM|nr:hypothetical protein [Thermomonas aquatica]QDA56997.1 hypothetical protein FHQ07_06535 [Thermomonas aquatica]